MKRQLAIAALAALALSAGPAEYDAAPLDAVLKDVVADGRVDYAAVKAKHYDTLKAWLAGYGVKPDGTAPLADLLNVYNATMLLAVVDHRATKPGWKPSDDNFGVFNEPRIRSTDGPKSLDWLETDVIRKKYSEPRIHVALCCAAVSCPPLLPRAYRTPDLDATLDANMKRFVADDAARNRFDDKARTARLSRIFDWFAADFGGKDKVPAYLAKYRPGNYAKWRLDFSDYDWTLNSR